MTFGTTRALHVFVSSSQESRSVRGGCSAETRGSPVMPQSPLGVLIRMPSAVVFQQPGTRLDVAVWFQINYSLTPDSGRWYLNKTEQ